MALLQVRSFPDTEYEALKEYAKREHRSVSQQVIVIIKNALEEQELFEIQKQKLHVRMLREQTTSMDDFPSPADLIREDRER